MKSFNPKVRSSNLKEAVHDVEGSRGRALLAKEGKNGEKKNDGRNETKSRKDGLRVEKSRKMTKLVVGMKRKVKCVIGTAR
jgi:hypothetical protein